MSAITRRILGRDDQGDDVQVIQMALNGYLTSDWQLPPPEWAWWMDSKRMFPTLWGYRWGPGAYAKVQRDERRAAKPKAKPRVKIDRIIPLQQDGDFGPKTEGAVQEFQRRCGLPEDGIVGPETWDNLFPFWRFRIWIPKERTPGSVPNSLRMRKPEDSGGGQSGQGGNGESKGPQFGNPFGPSDFDTVEVQGGVQSDKTAAFVLQGTWKTRREPNEVRGGQWNNTIGGQVNIPIDGSPGKNLQAYYQLTRDEWGTVEDFLGKDNKLTYFAPFVQPYIQFPLDGGTSANPNTTKVGVNIGTTLSMEIKLGEGKPSVKLFVQGTVGGSVDGGGAHFEKQAFGGVSFAFDEAALLNLVGKKKQDPSKPTPKVGVRVQPPVLAVPRGGTAGLDVQVDRNGNANRFVVALQNLPTGVSAERVILGPDYMGRLQTGAQVPVSVGANATPGEYTVLVDVRNEAPPIRSLTEEPARFVLKVQ
jgi:peptidoglycan hydrolase-like protein with peptidoglycan-binding domain